MTYEYGIAVNQNYRVHEKMQRCLLIENLPLLTHVIKNAYFQAMGLDIPIQQRFEGCIFGGAIGDAWGSAYENQNDETSSTTFYLQPQTSKLNTWSITDDTQLTLAACELLADNTRVTPEKLGLQLVQYYKKRRLTGLGASTLKAIKELEAGIHWSMTGRTGEYAAGNGAAMRIAPFAFDNSISREDIHEFCRITHRNDEAYAGALAVFLCLRIIINNQWHENNLLKLIILQLPDTNLRDRLIRISNLTEKAGISDVARLGNSGYVVDSIPFALFAASQIRRQSFGSIIEEIIDTKGDTDTNASIAGQIAGSYLGINGLPENLRQKLAELPDFTWITEVVNKTKNADIFR